MSRLSSQSIFEGVEALKQIVRPVEKRRNILQERRTHRKDGAVTMRRRLFFRVPDTVVQTAQIDVRCSLFV